MAKSVPPVSAFILTKFKTDPMRVLELMDVAPKICLNTLAQGWVMTQKQKDLWVTKEGLAAHVARQCLYEAFDPDDFLGGSLFLATQSSKMMTSQPLVIDCGVVTTG